MGRIMAGSSALLGVLRDAIGRILSNRDLKRGFLFSLGSFLVLGILMLLLVQPSELSPFHIILVSVLLSVTIIAMLVLNLFD
jgi:hypothetical protein